MEQINGAKKRRQYCQQRFFIYVTHARPAEEQEFGKLPLTCEDKIVHCHSYYRPRT